MNPQNHVLPRSGMIWGSPSSVPPSSVPSASAWPQKGGVCFPCSAPGVSVARARGMHRASHPLQHPAPGLPVPPASLLSPRANHPHGPELGGGLETSLERCSRSWGRLRWVPSAASERERPILQGSSEPPELPEEIKSQRGGRKPRIAERRAPTNPRGVSGWRHRRWEVAGTGAVSANGPCQRLP